MKILFEVSNQSLKLFFKINYNFTQNFYIFENSNLLGKIQLLFKKFNL